MSHQVKNHRGFSFVASVLIRTAPGPTLQIDLGCGANYYRSQRCPRNLWLDNFWGTIVSWNKLERGGWA